MKRNGWDDLLLSGGFAPRAALLRGLTLAQVSERPGGATHSIYQELWHAAMALRISLNQGRAALERWPYEGHFPAAAAPASQAEWAELVASFLEDSKKAVEWAEDETWLFSAEPDYETSQWRDGLEFLAVHTAYHLGKIVCLRQVMNLWPPAKV